MKNLIILMAEPNAFAIFFGAILILVGLPMFLFGIIQYPSSLGFSILALSIFMLILGAFFIIIMLTQK